MEENVSQTRLITLQLWWDLLRLKYCCAITYCCLLKVKKLAITGGQSRDKEAAHQTHTAISLQYCPRWQWGAKIATVFHQRLYVNPATGVSVHRPVDPSPAKSPGDTPAVILKCHLCPPELLFVCNAGEETGVQWGVGCGLWLIVKCCPGALCQTPLNGLHSRKQSVAVTKGLVGTGPVMIDLQWNSEDVWEKWEMSQRTRRSCAALASEGVNVWPLHKELDGWD